MKNNYSFKRKQLKFLVHLKLITKKIKAGIDDYHNEKPLTNRTRFIQISKSIITIILPTLFV